jgi:hypothetical protein
MKEIFELNGTETNPPNNYPELSIQLNYDIDGVQQSLGINDWEFGVMNNNSLDGAFILKNILRNPNGVGIIEGVPWKIYLDNERGKRWTLFDGYIDLWKAQYDNGKVTAPAVQTGNIDWLNDYSDSFSFEYLYSIGFFDKSKFIPIPYIVVKKQDAFEIAMTLVTIFLIVDKIRDQITSIAQLATGSANPLEMSSIPRLILQIIYLILLFASLIPLILNIINILCPPIKYHNAMYLKDLFQIGCKYMNLEFRSSIIENPEWNDVVIMPEKYNLVENNTGIFAGIAGNFKNSNEKVGYFKGAFGDFLRAMKTMFYGKVVISEGVLYFEPFDFKLGNSGITIPDRFDNKDSFTLNYEDFYSTMIVSFMVDLADRNTIQEYLGTSVQVSQVPKTAIFQQRNLLRGLYEARVPFALAKTKTELTRIEQILLDFSAGIQVVLTIVVTSLNIAIIAINILIAVINKILKSLATIGIKIKIKLNPIKKIPTPSIKNLIKNRVGVLKMESDFVAVPKIFKILPNGRISPNNQSVVNARKLFMDFHSLKSFVSVNGKPSNQFMLKSNPEFPFSSDNYETVINNNAIFTPQGQSGELITLDFNPTKQTASTNYKIRHEYITNLKLDIYEPTGE